MKAREQFCERLTQWLGADRPLSMESDQIEIQHERLPSIWLKADIGDESLVALTFLPLNAEISPERAEFLLKLNYLTSRRGGCIIGAELQSGTLTLSRRCNPSDLTEERFVLLLAQLWELVEGVEKAWHQGNAKPVVESIKQTERSQESSRKSAELIAHVDRALANGAIAAEKVATNRFAIHSFGALASCEIIGPDLIVSSANRIDGNRSEQRDLAAKALKRNLALAGCYSSGFYIDPENKIGTICFIGQELDLTQELQDRIPAMVRDLISVTEKHFS